METILERYETLPYSHRVSDEVENAHDDEDAACRRIAKYFKSREAMEKKLLVDWAPQEIQNAGLQTPRNPRQIFAELEAKAEDHLSSELAGSRELVALIWELESTLSPLLRSLPPAE